MDLEAACTGLARGTPPDPCLLVIFGAAGDLARTKVVPALYALGRQGLLPEPFAIIGFARREWDDEAFRGAMRAAVAKTKKLGEEWQTFARNLSYVRGDFTAPAAGDYSALRERLPRKLTEISIHFKPTPHLMFPVGDRGGLQHNTLAFRLQPDEGILHRFLAKQPGPDLCLRPVTMRFRYDTAFGVEELPGAYEWLLLDAMHGDQTLFPRSDWIYKAWSIVDPLVRNWEAGPAKDLDYAAGTWGPAAADDLLGREGRTWQVV